MNTATNTVCTPDSVIPGPLTGSAAGIILKELVRRAMTEIARQRFSFVAEAKVGYSGMPDDVFTTADTAAQEIYLRSLRECFPGYGIIGEEADLNIPCTIPNQDLYFTIDPLDGTKAYKRLQSYGVGTMIALVDGVAGKVLSAWIGDPFNMEVFGFRPGGTSAWRINRLDTATELPSMFDPASVSLSVCGIAREHKQERPICRHLVNKSKKCLVEGSSIGIMFSRLWTGECTYLLLEPSWMTPWDETPLIGICEMLGYQFWEPNKAGDGWVLAPPFLVKRKIRRETELLVAHKTFSEEIRRMEIVD